MSREQANDLYWVSDKLAKLSLELASGEEDFELVNDEFDELYTYIDRYKNEHNLVEGGLNFRHADGRRINVGICLILTDVIDEE